MRRKIIAGNWKMNKNWNDAKALFKSMCTIPFEYSSEVVVLPPSIYLADFSCCLPKNINVFLGAQNCSEKSQGAFTGEVSADMLASVGVNYCLVGHSERRKYYAESDQLCLEKVLVLLNENIVPILCVGEELEVREAGKHFDVVKQQINGVLKHLNRDQVVKTVIAYEPVWAIGTGKTASTEQAAEMHGYIRSLVAEHFGENIANSVSILYGGSVNEKNALEILHANDIDGVLVGGASLKTESFYSIIEAGNGKK